jgi:mycoredoxin
VALMLVVRSVNDGIETVPTVFVGDQSHTNPSRAWVRQALRS